MTNNFFNFVKFSSFIIFVTFFNSILNAQISYLDSLEGKFSLQFQISNNFKLEEFQGTTFSGKFNIGKSEAIRLGVSLDAETWD